jgi:hypothetical protein
MFSFKLIFFKYVYRISAALQWHLDALYTVSIHRILTRLDITKCKEQRQLQKNLDKIRQHFRCKQ